MAKRRRNRLRGATDLDLIQRELDLQGVNLDMVLPPWASKGPARQAVLSELLTALKPPVHEGLISPSGTIILPENAEAEVTVPLEMQDLDLARKAADGSSALLTWREEAFAGLILLNPSGTPDLDLARLVRSSTAVAIRRERSGAIRLYAPEHNLNHLARVWTSSQAVGPALDRIYRTASMVNLELLAKLLEFAYYVLSPWRIGATLVWLLSDRHWEDAKIDLQRLHLHISPNGKQPSLAFTAHLLAQVDGATIISRDGRLLSTGVQLKPSSKATELVREFRGTRHTSAIRASFDLSDALLITVSADGPVTVFSDGVNISEFWWYSATSDAEHTQTIVPAVKDLVFPSSYPRVCPKCGKTSMVEELVIAGWRDHEEASCPVCGETLATGHCFHLHANILKTF